MDENVQGNRTTALPVRYSYRPPMMEMVVGMLGISTGAVLFVFNGHFLCGLVLLALCILFAVLGVIHHFSCKPYLELGEDEIVVPSGFCHRQFIRIPYAMIDWIQVDERFLNIRAAQPKAGILKSCLRKKDFDAIVAFLVPLAVKNMVARREQILAHPEIDHRQIKPQAEMTPNECNQVPYPLPGRDAFIAFWKDHETFHWRDLVPYILYVGGLGVYAVLVKWFDPAGRFMFLSLGIAIAYVFLAPTLTWRFYRKKYAQFIRCYRCGDYFGLDLSGAWPRDNSTFTNPKREIIAQTSHCVKCGARVLASGSLEPEQAVK